MQLSPSGMCYGTATITKKLHNCALFSTQHPCYLMKNKTRFVPFILYKFLRSHAFEHWQFEWQRATSQSTHGTIVNILTSKNTKIDVELVVQIFGSNIACYKVHILHSSQSRN